MSRIISKTFHTKAGQIDAEVNIYFDDLRERGIHCDVVWVNVVNQKSGYIIKSYTLNMEG